MLFSSMIRRAGGYSAVRGAAMMCAIAGMCITATAFAQPASKGGQEKQYTYEKRLGGGSAAEPAQPGSTGSGRSVMIQQTTGDDGREYSLRIEDGKVVWAKIDGKEVPKDRIRHEGNTVEILDENGKVVHTAEIAPLPAQLPSQPSWRGLRVTPRGPGGPDAAVEAWTPPPVMLGITMSEPEQEVAEHLGVKADEAIRIDSVIEGLPASAAGLQVHDVITSIDGKKPVNREMLLQHLRGKKPGDTIELTVISKGKQRDVKVELESYDASKLGPVTMNVPGAQQWLTMEPGTVDELKGLFAERLGQAKPKLDEARRAIEQAITQLKEATAEGAEKARDKAVELLADALAKLESKSEDAMGQLQRFYSATPAPSAPAAPEAGEARPRVYITPVPSAPGADQMDRLTSALERMEKRLAELEARLEKRQREAEEKAKSSER